MLINAAIGNKEVVISLAIVSFIVNIYILSLASSAMGFGDQRLGDIDFGFFKQSSVLKAQVLFPIGFAITIDILCLIILLILVVIALCSLKFSEDMYAIVLSLTVLCPIFSVIAHSPYIAVAYLNDGDHASSIFIYYAILIYVLFGITWLFVHWCHKIQPTEGTKCNSYCKKVSTIILLFSAILCLLGLFVLIVCYLVLIPINKAVSDAPNRILSIYQSGGFLIGSFIVFKLLKRFT